MKLTSIEQTCLACPSQWEGKLKSGRMIYVRYRWGTLNICVSKFPTDDFDWMLNVIEYSNPTDRYAPEVYDDLVNELNYRGLTSDTTIS
jgi:hypothetical protein